MTSESGGAAFNPMVHTEDNVPAEPERDDEQHDDQADDGHHPEEE
jgi:hypothetical protein